MSFGIGINTPQPVEGFEFRERRINPMPMQRSIRTMPGVTDRVAIVGKSAGSTLLVIGDFYGEGVDAATANANLDDKVLSFSEAWIGKVVSVSVHALTLNHMQMADVPRSVSKPMGVASGEEGVIKVKQTFRLVFESLRSERTVASGE